MRQFILSNHEAWRVCLNCGHFYDLKMGLMCFTCGYKHTEEQVFTIKN